jgi:hypothetical protein
MRKGISWDSDQFQTVGPSGTNSGALPQVVIALDERVREIGCARAIEIDNRGAGLAHENEKRQRGHDKKQPCPSSVGHV